MPRVVGDPGGVLAGGGQGGGGLGFALLQGDVALGGLLVQLGGAGDQRLLHLVAVPLGVGAGLLDEAGGLAGGPAAHVGRLVLGQPEDLLRPVAEALLLGGRASVRPARCSPSLALARFSAACRADSAFVSRSRISRSWASTWSRSYPRRTTSNEGPLLAGPRPPVGTALFGVLIVTAGSLSLERVTLNRRSPGGASGAFDGRAPSDAARERVVRSSHAPELLSSGEQLVGG